MYPKASLPLSHIPVLEYRSVGGKARAKGLAPVVGCSGLIRLHKAIVFVSRVVGSQDIHLIPALRLPKVREGHSKGGRSSGDPLLTERSPSFFPAFKNVFLYSLVEARMGARYPVIISVVWLGFL